VSDFDLAALHDAKDVAGHFRRAQRNDAAAPQRRAAPPGNDAARTRAANPFAKPHVLATVRDMSRGQKVMVYVMGFLLGLLVLAVLPEREGVHAREHPWHAQTAPDGYYPLTVTDDHGREIAVERQPRHFISLAPSVTELLFAMEMGDHLVAVTQWCDYPEQAKALRDAGASIGNMDTPNREMIAAYRPDIVIGSRHTPPEVYGLLHQPPRTLALAIEHDSLDDLYGDIRTLGTVLGVPGHAVKLLARLREAQAAVDARVAPHRAGEPKRVVLLYGIEDGLIPGWSPGLGTWIGDLIERAHGVNIAAASGSSWGQISLEALAAADPEVILLIDGRDDAERAALREKVARLADHPVWRHVSAVREGRIAILETGPMTIPGPRMTDAYRLIADALWATP